MSPLVAPIITLNKTENTSTGYFSHRHNVSTDSTLVAKGDSKHELLLENDPPIITSEKHNMPSTQLYPLSIPIPLITQKNQSEPLLLSPHSILQKTSFGSPSITKRIVFPNKDRRPSVVTFSCDEGSSIFYDTVSGFDENHDEEDKQWQKRPPMSPTATADKRSLRSWKMRRPSIQSRISSYTQRTTAISILHQFDHGHLQQGIVLCATVSVKQKLFDSQPKYNHQQEFRKRALKWTEYRAVMTKSGYLELYSFCHCSHENDLLHMSFHQHNLYYKKPRYVIDLRPVMNQRKKRLFSRRGANANDAFFLSLLSPVDFSWSLSSANKIFYFQTPTAHQSQQWYQALYAYLPVQCKKPMPKVVDLNIPQLNICARLPLSELMQVGDENVDLRRVRDSALVLLHRHGNRPADWSKRTVGVCWRYKNQLDWVVKPATDEDQGIAYLVEPRLIEKTHDLELRYYCDNDTNDGDIKEEEDPIEGLLIDKYKKNGSPLYYGATEDHFLFLYENHNSTKEDSVNQRLICFKFLFSKKRYQTFPSSGSLKSPSAIIGVIDLLQIKQISYEEEILHLDEGCAFQTVNHPIHDWSTRLEAIQNYYRHNVHDGEIKQSGILYMKSSIGSYTTFEQRLCILTKRGDFYAFKSDSAKNKSKKILDFHLSLMQGVYIYSGQECCSYIAGLPIELPSRLFDSGMVVERNQDKPKQCCFVFHFKNERHIFLTRTQDQKEIWVQSIFSIIQ